MVIVEKTLKFNGKRYAEAIVKDLGYGIAIVSTEIPKKEDFVLSEKGVHIATEDFTHKEIFNSENKRKAWRILQLPTEVTEKTKALFKDGLIKNNDTVLIECEFGAFNEEGKPIQYAMQKGDYTVRKVKDNAEVFKKEGPGKITELHFRNFLRENNLTNLWDSWAMQNA